MSKSRFVPSAEIKKSVNLALGYLAKKISTLEQEAVQKAFTAELPTAAQMGLTAEKAERVASQYVKCRKDGLEKKDAFRKAYKSAVTVEKASAKIGTAITLPDGSKIEKRKDGWKSVQE